MRDFGFRIYRALVEAPEIKDDEKVFLFFALDIYIYGIFFYNILYNFKYN